MSTFPDTAAGRYVAEMIPAASAWMNGDKGPMIAHCLKYPIHFPDDDHVRHAIVCKTVTGNTNFPMEMRTRAKQWLLANGLTPFDDGDVPV